MRTIDAATLTSLQSRIGVVAHLLVWIAAKNRATGVTQTIGFTTQAQDTTHVIDGSSRLYLGAGTMLGVEPVVAEAGVTVRMQTIRLSGISAEVAQALRGYDARLAPLWLHRVLYRTAEMTAFDTPQLLFRGSIDQVKFTTPEIGGSGAVEVVVASAARDLTRGLALKKSDESQKLRSGDRFRRWADVTGRTTVWWGQRAFQQAPVRPTTGPVLPPQFHERPE